MPVQEVISASAFADAHKSARGKLVVCDFYATWCGPCKVVAPPFEQLSNTYKDTAIFIKIDCDKVREVAQEAGVKGMPSFGFYVDGKLLELQMGGNMQEIETKIRTLSEKYSTYAFKGQGHSLTGPSSTGARPAAPAAAAAGGAAGGSSRRPNPWADPNFKLAQAAKGAGSSSSSAAAPTASASSAAAAAPKPTQSHAPPNRPIPGEHAAAKPAAAAASTSSPAAAAPSPAVTAASTVPTSSASAPASSASSAPASASSTSAAASAAPATASASAAPAVDGSAPRANDAALTKNLNSAFLQTLTEFGFPRIRAEKALILTQNKSVEAALDWLSAHEKDADIDEPLQITGTATKAASNVNLDAMDEDERLIYEEMQIQKLAAKGVSYGGASSSSGEGEKKRIADMTSEEKMQWLAQRRAEVKAQKEKEAMVKAKEAEKNRQARVKGAQAVDELKERLARESADAAIRAKKKEEEEKRRAKQAILAKIEEDKKRRREQHEREVAALAAAKAAQANKK